MAGFCKKCGAPVAFSSGFCPSCGASLEAEPIAPAPPVAVPVVVPAAAVPQPIYAAAPPKKSGGALKIILIIIAVVVVLGVAGAGIIGYISYRALHAAGSSFSLGKNADVSDADLGVSIYPGAVRNPNGGMKVNLANNLIVSATYTTSDAATDVLSYYQGKLGPNATKMQIGPVSSLTLATTDGSEKDTVVITVTPGAQAGAQTQIMIQHTQTTKS